MARRIDRRHFLKGLLTTGSIAWLVQGSGFSGKALGDVFTHPVPFIQDPSCSTTPHDPGLLDRSFFHIDARINPAAVFRQSVASGDPRPNGIVLWTRVDPQSASFYPQSPVAYQIAADANFSQVIL